MEEMKALVEQLRDIVEESRKGGAFPTWYAGGFITNCPYNSDVDYERELFATIADRIEKEYIPRPRFDDGEPVQFGDKFYSDEHGKTYKATMFVIYADGSFRVNQAGCNACQYEPGERVKRPAPDVLDADGVPIKVGDVVYFVDSAEAFDVLGIESDGDEPVHIGRNDRTSTDAWVSPGDLTHELDTLERIEKDAMKTFEEYWGCCNLECSECPSMIDGKRPWERYVTGIRCTAAQKLDLLRRQREVLERGQE